MKKGQRPGKHIRRIKTRYGRRARTINRHIRRRASITVKYPSKLPEGISQQQARALAQAYMMDVQSHLKQGHPVKIPELGVFKIKKIPAKPKRKGINPFTGKEQMFKAKPASKKLNFFRQKH